jgi:hypothetical protein
MAHEIPPRHLRNRGHIKGRAQFGEPSDDDRDRTDIG